MTEANHGLELLLRFACFRALGHRRSCGAFAWLCASLGLDLDSLINQGVRGYQGAELMARIRRQAPAPLWALLERRLAQGDGALLWRTRIGAAVARVASRDDLASHDLPDDVEGYVRSLMYRAEYSLYTE